MAVAFVNRDDCTACEACVEVCPADAITMVDDAALVDPGLCTACEDCVSECPVECIVMKEV
jgi:electron transport complex protein RnfB